MTIERVCRKGCALRSFWDGALPEFASKGSIDGKSYTPHESAIPKLLIW